MGDGEEIEVDESDTSGCYRTFTWSSIRINVVPSRAPPGEG